MDKSLRLISAIVIATGLFIVYGVARTHALDQQHHRGLATSGNSATAELQSETVLGIGDLYITYDSTPQDSALWVASPSGTLRSWIVPPPEAPFDFDSVLRWKDPGRVLWSNTGTASADLLIDLGTKTSHRLVIVRVTCEHGQCGASERERGLIPGTQVTVADDGVAILLSDNSITRYASIADLMNVTAETTLPRLTRPEQRDLVAPSINATLIVTNPETLTGEAIEGPDHFKMRLQLDQPGTADALILGSDLGLVIDAARVQYWDCPSNILSGSAECTVYSAPATFPRTLPVSISDTECGIVISRGGWTWIVRRIAKNQDVFRADGIAGCRNGEIDAYQGRHVTYIEPKRASLTVSQQTARFNRLQ